MHVPLLPIGSALKELPADARASADELARREAELLALKEEVAQGWGEKYVARVHQKGKMTARERVLALSDEGAPILDFGTFVNLRERFAGDAKSPAAGVITALVRVHGRIAVVVANDNTVASGAWWPRTPEKIERAQGVALRLGLPVLYLVDCSGLFLPEQGRSFPGPRGAGHIFKMNSLLSSSGVPQVAGVFGDCIAGGGYMPIISDRVFMTEQAYMVLAGAALIKGAKSQHITSLDIGGPEVHVHQSGCADVRAPDDTAVLHLMREEMKKLPSSAVPFYRGGCASLPPAFSTEEIGAVIPVDHRHSYDAAQVLARLADQSLVWELRPQSGVEVMCAVVRFSGLYAGVIMNRQGLLSEPTTGERKVGGTLYREGIAKLSAFRRACEDDGLPLFWLQDVAGFDIGAEAERRGLLAYGSSLIYGNSEATAPNFAVLLRRASGAGYYAMHGMPYDPVLQLSTVLSRLAVMEGRTLAIAAYRTKLNDDFEIAAKSEQERDSIEKGMAEVEQRIERDMDPFTAASQMDTDEVVALSDLRLWLSTLTEASYQATGVRKIKNSRIWSLHDLAAL